MFVLKMATPQNWVQQTATQDLAIQNLCWLDVIIILFTKKDLYSRHT